MTDTHGRFRDKDNPEELPPPPPRSAYELYMAARKNHADVSMWFTDDNCPLCKMPVYTDGKTLWCSIACKNNNVSRGTYAAFQEDYVR